RSASPESRAKVAGLYRRLVQYASLLSWRQPGVVEIDEDAVPAAGIRRAADADRDRAGDRHDAAAAGRVRAAVRRSGRRALVLFRASESSAEPVLPVRLVTAPGADLLTLRAGSAPSALIPPSSDAPFALCPRSARAVPALDRRMIRY